MNRKGVASFELLVVIVSLFAFAYFLSFDMDFVSAVEQAGCCSLTSGGEKCATATEATCNGTFAAGSVCSETSFCEKGCCYDGSAGIFDKNVLEGDCEVSWVRDANCNLEEATLGCCFLGDQSEYETEGQCRVDTLALGFSSLGLNWSSDVGEINCLLLAASNEDGACVFEGGGCERLSEVECLEGDGEYYSDSLCTAGILNASCEMTAQTTCVDGKDGVYFVDSCGNVANVYDSSKVNDEDYWTHVVDVENSCGFNDEGGNADSGSCGNCDRFAGGICGSASEDDFGVDYGDYYCESTSCTYDGEVYENGESWCVYDGAIGDGDDVVGSRHWKYVCSQGVVQIEPCADYRNQICVQSSSEDRSGGEFYNAACVANNWRACLAANEEEDVGEACGDAVNCRIDEVRIGEQFSFDVCLPEYPAGFSLSGDRYSAAASKLCGLASQTCTVVRKAKRWGGCEIVTNAGCLTGTFTQEMNDFCRGIGDCGGSVNIVGDWGDSYSVSGAPVLSEGWVAGLIDLMNPVDGQYAEVEDYSEYLEAAGILNLNAVNLEEEAESEGYIGFGSGLAGIGLAMNYAGRFVLSDFGGGALGVELFGHSASVASLAGAAMGISAGMVAGAMLAGYLELTEGGSQLMAVGGALVGGVVGYYFSSTGGLASIGIVGVSLIGLGLALMLIASFFSSSSCDPIYVDFECKEWKPVSGAERCEVCNDDPLKPCSEYRCESLGAGCSLINEGTNEEMCYASDDDGLVPTLSANYDAVSSGSAYNDVSDAGFSLTSSGGGCLDAYETISFGFTTSEPTYCKFGIVDGGFEDLSYDFGTNSYTYDHTASFSLPDPSHGESQGWNWTGDLSFYVKCEDVFGNLNGDSYVVDTCVNQGSDVTAPVVRGVYPNADLLVGFDVNESSLSVVTNELANCSWSLNDVSYDEMENVMSCEDSLGVPSDASGYLCEDILEIENGSTTYYINCVDQPWGNEGNTMPSNYVYVLSRPDEHISIDSISPSIDFEVGTELTTVNLTVSTSGGGNEHFCSYSFSGYDTMIEIFETGGRGDHLQSLTFPYGENTVYVECEDETGDFVRGETSFEIILDNSNPQIARVWQNSGRLYVVTNEDVECKYSEESCRFDWDNEGVDMGSGEEHTISVVEGVIYYVKCEDGFGNRPSGCSVQVSAV